MNRAYTLDSSATSMTRNQVIEKTIKLDSSLGRDTEFIFDYSGNNIIVTVYAPNGVNYTTSSPECTRDTTFGIYRFNIPGISAVSIHAMTERSCHLTIV